MTRANDDCYFYYYSTCAKGNMCTFRHCADALGNETVCPQWQEDRCFTQNCQLRHAEIVKDRKRIPCYWESQPGGCKKEHCVFMHNKTKTTPPVQARHLNLLSAESSEPGSIKRSGSQADVIKENAVPSPKVNPVLITMDHDDENSNGDKVASPTASFSPIKVTGPKTIRTKKSLEKVEEPTQLNFGIKSLEQIRKEKERLRPAFSIDSVSSKAGGTGPADSSPESSASATQDCKPSPSSPVKQQGVLKGVAIAKTHGELRQERSNKSITGATSRADGQLGSPLLQRSPVKLTTNQVSLRPLPKKDQVQDAAEVRVKTFAEIMEEKKKRKELALKEGNADTGKEPEEVAAGSASAPTRGPTLTQMQPPSRQFGDAASTKGDATKGDDSTKYVDSTLPNKLPSLANSDPDATAVAASTVAVNEDVSRRTSAATRPTASVAPLGEPRVDAEQGLNHRASKRKPSVSSKSAAVSSDEVGNAAKRSKSSDKAEGAVESEAEVPVSSSSTEGTAPSGEDRLLLGLDDDDKELDELLRSDNDAGGGTLRSSASLTSVNDDDLMREMAVLLQ